MAQIISIFNNKGGVGKSTICWNLGHALANLGKRVLLIDFDPQCNLSIAMLGEATFVKSLPTQNAPYGATIRAFLQRFLQNTGGEEVFLHRGAHTNQHADLIAGDFWLNVYADSLNVGNDLLMGSGLARYVALRKIVVAAEAKANKPYDFVLVDLPPSFSVLVRAAFYSSDFFIVPCTSDSFSVYCVGLIGQMVPAFISDWDNGLRRFKSTNPHFADFDPLGRPAFAGWVFNGFDTARRRRTSGEIQAGVEPGEKEMNQADSTMHARVSKAISEDLVQVLKSEITHYNPIADEIPDNFQIGDIEDGNVLIQNSLFLSVPLGDLDQHHQVVQLRDRKKWADNQLEQIGLFKQKFKQLAERVVNICE